MSYTATTATTSGGHYLGNNQYITGASTGTYNNSYTVTYSNSSTWTGNSTLYSSGYYFYVDSMPPAPIKKEIPKVEKPKSFIGKSTFIINGNVYSKKEFEKLDSSFLNQYLYE